MWLIGCTIACDLTSAAADWPRCRLPGVSLWQQAATACDRRVVEHVDGGGGGRGCQYDTDRELLRGPAGNGAGAAAAGTGPRGASPGADRPGRLAGPRCPLA